MKTKRIIEVLFLGAACASFFVGGVACLACCVYNGYMLLLALPLLALARLLWRDKYYGGDSLQDRFRKTVFVILKYYLARRAAAKRHLGRLPGKVVY